ncbi:zinc finger MYM-type protein 1-like [Diabrotica virgifera virgifera]|uniref:TTF-type domain-containing protein n=1 Tax=Diabrotica virgifera virgifera TaxID=50390 RepID=A0ABM5KQR4_DIAVI|nr:zinc finger MYM-type protein 1-like [Diabrotica virgifera virgifera]
MDFSMSKRNFGEQHMYAGKQIFDKRLVNGEVVRRDWAIYSESTGNIFCLYCVLFGNKKNQFKTGFSLWNKSKERLDEHERSNDHIDNLKMYMTRLLKQGRVDVELEKEISTAKEYWVKVLERIISVIKFLATRELAFRGTHERIGEKRNGNYLGLLELLSEYDPFLKDHINKRANLGKGKTSYLSKDICNELLNILSNRVIDEIVRQIKANKYYSISVDSTPGITHHDQLTVILRYCDNKGNPVERFVGFYKNTGHSSQQLEETVIGMLESLKLDIKNCRGQSYDNASNMSGKYSGLKARIKAYNDLALFVPCAAHSLNLVVQNAADCCLEATSFFMLVQAIYNFFSVSTHRWELLSRAIKDSAESGQTLLPKRVNTTRWSSRFDAVKALKSNYGLIKTCLIGISTDIHEKNIVRVEAASLSEKLDLLENGIILSLWLDVLQRANEVNKSVQKENMDFSTTAHLLSSLADYFDFLRDRFDHYEALGMLLTGNENYAEKRIIKKKMQLGEMNSEASLSQKEKMRTQCYVCIIDNLKSEIIRRSDSYKSCSRAFNILFKLKATEDEDIFRSATELQQNYKEDLDEYFPQECVHLNHLLTSLPQLKIDTPLEFVQALYENKLISSFRKVNICLRIFFSIMVANASGERSLSTLKRVKTYLRNAISQENLNSLAVLSINEDLLNELNISDIIENFASVKSRKQAFQ